MRIVAFNVMHDSSLCSYVDGKIEFYCKEERLSRVKRDKDPFLCLEEYRKQNFGKVDHFLYLTPSNIGISEFWVYAAYVRKMFGVELENFSDLKHHDCHASISFYNSQFSEALVFVIDRNGSIYFQGEDPVARESESVYYASYLDCIFPIYKSFFSCDESFKYERLKRSLSEYYDLEHLELNITNSNFGLVKVYEAATTLIGQDPLENGKTMGLSSYGENLNYPPLFMNGSPISNYFSSIEFIEEDSSCFQGCENDIVQNVDENNFQFYANKAKHVQLETQKEVLRLIEKFVGKTGITNVCLSGGYGLNVVANNFYIQNLPNVNFYFEPLSDDSGITIGACMLKYRMESQDKNKYSLNNNFFHFYDKSDNQVYGKSTNTLDLITYLEDQKIIAIFDGNPESGPRALGHRSLLFDPRNVDGKNIVNTLKKREWYRPFAGIILEECFEEYFYTFNIKSSDSMMINFECKPGVEKYVPSIIHIDNTCRIQTVSPKDNFLYELLREFYKKTNCPMLLNTSFNLAGEPLVHTKNDVINFMKNVKNNDYFSGVYFVNDKTFLTNPRCFD